MSTIGRWTSFGKCSGKIIYKIVEKLLTNTERGCIIKVEINERATARKELKMIYTVFINGNQKDYSDRRKAYAMARLYGAVVFTHERYITTLKEVLRG